MATYRLTSWGDGHSLRREGPCVHTQLTERAGDDVVMIALRMMTYKDQEGRKAAKRQRNASTVAPRPWKDKF